MKSYYPYISGALAGALLAVLLSSLFGLTGTLQLAAFGCLPVIGGAFAERYSQR
jgi:uncharacterized membrane protein